MVGGNDTAPSLNVKPMAAGLGDKEHLEADRLAILAAPAEPLREFECQSCRKAFRCIKPASLSQGVVHLDVFFIPRLGKTELLPRIVVSGRDAANLDVRLLCIVEYVNVVLHPDSRRHFSQESTLAWFLSKTFPERIR
jgi:hypothetical protein